MCPYTESGRVQDWKGVAARKAASWLPLQLKRNPGPQQLFPPLFLNKGIERQQQPHPKTFAFGGQVPKAWKPATSLGQALRFFTGRNFSSNSRKRDASTTTNEPPGPLAWTNLNSRSFRGSHSRPFAKQRAAAEKGRLLPRRPEAGACASLQRATGAKRCIRWAGHLRGPWGVGCAGDWWGKWADDHSVQCTGFGCRPAWFHAPCSAVQFLHVCFWVGVSPRLPNFKFVPKAFKENNTRGCDT